MLKVLLLSVSWTAAKGSCTNENPCSGNQFCNFDDGSSGKCERCSDCAPQCGMCGLPDKGVDDCFNWCTSGDGNYYYSYGGWFSYDYWYNEAGNDYRGDDYYQVEDESQSCSIQNQVWNSKGAGQPN